MARDKPTKLVDLWLDPDTVYRLSEVELFALPGVSVGLRCNINQYKLLRDLDDKPKPEAPQEADE